MADSDKRKYEDDGEPATFPNKRFQKSAFEREKEEREAKELQEELARKRVLEEFRQEHGDEGDDDGTNVPVPSSGRRHFTGNSGLKSKAELEALNRADEAKVRARFFSSQSNISHKIFKQLSNIDSRPALHLTPLPTGTSEDEVFAFVNDFVPDELLVEEVLIQDDTKPSTWYTGYMPHQLPHHHLSALVIFASDTPLQMIKSAEEELQGEYFGKGSYVKVRATTECEIFDFPSLAPHEQQFPFGATPINRPSTVHHAFGKPPPPSLQVPSSGYQSYSRAPPPPSYSAPSATQIPSYPVDYEVVVEYPEDLDEIRIIHSTIEKVLTVGPVVEELLMNQEDVQKDETWAWLWDQNSVAGRYYRWRLWEQSVPPEQIRERNVIFEGEAPWRRPKRSLPFEFCTSLEEMANHPDFMNIKSDEEIEEVLKDDPDESEQVLQAQNGDFEFLGPWLASELQHHLDNLPNNPANLIEKDLKFVVVFALDYAGKATKEIAGRLIIQLEAAYNRALDSLVPKSIMEHLEQTKPNTISKTPEVGMVDATQTVQLVDTSELSHTAPLLQGLGNAAPDADTRSSEATITARLSLENTINENDSAKYERTKQSTIPGFYSDATESGAAVALTDLAISGAKAFHDAMPEDNQEEALSMAQSFASYDDDYESMDYEDDYEPEIKPERERWPNAKSLEDPSGPILVALYVLTDVMAQAKDEGDYKKMRYAVEFEEILKSTDIFSNLGRLDREFGWGKMRADRWRTKVTDIFDQWESSNLMKKEAIEQFRNEFNNPLQTEDEQEEAKGTQGKNASVNTEPARPKFKPIGQPATEVHLDTKPVSKEAVEGKAIEERDVDGEPMSEDEGIDGKPLSEKDGIDRQRISEEEDIDGKPMTESEDESTVTTNGKGAAMMNNDRMVVDKDITKAMEDEEGIDGVPMSDEEDINGVPMTPSDEEAEKGVNRSNEQGQGAAVHAAVLENAGGTRVTSQLGGEGPLSTVSGQAPARSAALQDVPKRPISFALKGAAKVKSVKPKALGGSDSEASDKE